MHKKHGTVVEIVFDNLTEAESLQVEVDTILEFKYFGYSLVNQTSGGDSPVISEETRKRMSSARKGKNLSEDHKQSLRKAFLGKPRPDLLGKNSDTKMYCFFHPKNNETFYGTRVDFCKKYNKTPSGIRTLFQKARPNKSYHGWILLKE